MELIIVIAGNKGQTMDIIPLRLFKAINHLPLVYFKVNNIKFYYVLKNFDVKSLKDIGSNDLRYICGHLSCIIPYDLPRYKLDSIEFDILPKQNITNKQYKEILSYIPIKGYGS